MSRKTLVFLLLAAIPFTRCHAANSYWTNPAGGNFTNSANWSAGVPGPSDTAWFTNTASYEVDWTSSVTNTSSAFTSGTITTAVGNSIWFLSNQCLVETGTVIHTSGALVLTNASGTATLVSGQSGHGGFGLRGGTATLDQLLYNDTGNLYLFDYGTLTTRRGSTLNVGANFYIGGFSTNLTLVWNINGGTNYLIVNGFSSGVALGNNTRAIANVSGAGTVWTNTYSLTLGDHSALNITGGAQAFDEACWIGYFGSSNAVLVSGANSRWWHHNQLWVGYSSQTNSLTIASGGEADCGLAYIGYSSPAYGNIVTVTGSNSVWNCASNLVVGVSGSYGHLVITNGGHVSGAGPVSVGGGTSTLNYYDMIHNDVTVTGTGSVWAVAGSVTIGAFGAYSQMTVNNGGQVVSRTGLIGSQPSSSNCAVLVTDPGSLWTNSSAVSIGSFGGSNQLTIANGGQVASGGGRIGASWGSNNTVLVTDPGSLWNCSSNLYLNFLLGGSFNQLIVSNAGTVVTTNLLIGAATGTGSVVAVVGGNLAVTNAASTGPLTIRRGTLDINCGTVTVDRLVATNPGLSFVQFDCGLLNSRATVCSNGQQFVVGNGSSTAEYHLLGGTHSFSNSLFIQAHAKVTGCGTIQGGVVNWGTVLTDCGGTLTFTDVVTNNGVLRAINGSTLEFYAPVVNYGVIDIIGGNTNFHAGFVNNGSVVGPTGDYDGDGMSNLQEYLAGTDPLNDTSFLHITGLVRTNNSVLVTWMMGPGKTNALQAVTAKGFTTNFADIFIVTNTVGTVTNYLDLSASTNSPARFYRVRLVQ